MRLVPVNQPAQSPEEVPTVCLLARLVSVSGMVETPRLQAKQVFDCRGVTCHSGQRAGIQEIELLKLLDAGSNPA